jgi:hypothetical protein
VDTAVETEKEPAQTHAAGSESYRRMLVMA